MLDDTEPESPSEPEGASRVVLGLRWRRPSHAQLLRAARLSVPIAVIVFGVAFRWRFGLGSKAELNGDEAVIGLVARSFRHGRPVAFFPGQQYGGTLEAAVLAVAQWLFGQTYFALRIVPFITSVATVALVSRIAKRSGGNAWAAGAVAAVWPLTFVTFSVRELTFYTPGLLIALGIWWLVLTAPARPLAQWARWVALGLLCGLSYWLTAQTALLILPCLVAAGWRWWAERDRIAKAIAFIAAATLGAAPWIGRNLNTGFQSLDLASLAVDPEPYWRRLLISLRAVLFLPFGDTDHAVGDLLPDQTTTLILGVAFVILLATVGRRMRFDRIALAVLVLYPVIAALNPLTTPAAQQRYIYFLWPALVVLISQVIQSQPRLLPTCALLVACAVGVSWERQVYWHEVPHSVPEAVAGSLERSRADVVMASYWDAYPIEYLCNDRCPRIVPFFFVRDTPLDAPQPAEISYLLASPWAPLETVTHALDERSIAFESTPLSVAGYYLIHTQTPIDRFALGGELGP